MKDRPLPEDLLREYHLKSGPRRGRLKIFFGYAAGVGKTYAMLEAAHQARQEGLDVVAGYIEPHTRPDTLKLLEGLEALEPLRLSHRGIELREFDLDGALRRSPALILVDELAHTNAEGCRHSKRYQDVEELLHAGIDVYTTVNVQHLESLNDVVSSITGVMVRERVPDQVFDLADQVEVVDIEPDDLIARLEQGKIYREGQARQALDAFFSRKNLAALREIALRRTADRLSRTAQGTERGPAVGEHLLICLSASPSNAKVIRAAGRMADAFHSCFTALFVETSSFPHMRGDDLRRLRQNLKLAEDLGARIATVYGDDIATQIAEYARVSGVSKIVLGRTNRRRSILPSSKSLIDRLTVLAPNLDVFIIPDNQPSPYRNARPPRREAPRITARDLGKSLLTVCAATLLGIGFDLLGLTEANIITVYLLGVLAAAAWTNGRIYGALVSVLNVLAFNFFFTEPRFTLRMYGASYPVTLLVMLLAAFLASSLAIRIKRQGTEAARKAYRTEVLLETNQKLQKAECEQSILEETAGQLVKLTGRPVVFYRANSGRLADTPLLFAPEGKFFPPDALTADERAVAQWVYKNNKHAGATTNTLPGSKCLYLAVRAQEEVFAVSGIYMPGGEREPDSLGKNLLIAILGECGLALEKQRLMEAKRAVELKAQQEQLRSDLLRAISHDLRTPLTSISGNAGVLMENSAVLGEEKRRLLYTDIYDDAMWLVNLVENLLSVTRIENGSMNLRLEPELLDEVFHEALLHLDRRAAEHSIQVQVEDDLLMAEMDARLIVQVIINLVNNAIKYTQPGSHILLSARRSGNRVVISVADDGPGIPDESKKHLFEMFYTASPRPSDSRRGLGLGLSLCRSIVEAHGGTIMAEDNLPQGTVFTFSLKAAEVASYE